MAFVCVLAAVLAGACQSSGDLRERLEPRSGVTWLVEKTPLVFARTETRYSRSARDYLYLGPVETNRRGAREYYLWVGVATTLDRSYLAAELDVPDKLYVLVRDELLELELRPWADRVPDLSGVVVYEPSVKPMNELAARVTVDQLALLSSESLVSVRIGSGAGRTREYFRWADASGWPQFLARVGN